MRKVFLILVAVALAGAALADDVARVEDASGNLVGAYATLQEAVTAAAGSNGSTVTLLADVTISETLGVPSQSSTGKKFTIVGTGKTITHTGNNSFALSVGQRAGVNLTNVTIIASIGKGILYAYGSSGAIVDCNLSASAVGINVTGGTVTIDGGNYAQADYGVVNCSTWANGSVTINGGTFAGKISVAKGTVAINGGTFNSFSVDATSAANITVANAGAKFDNATALELCAAEDQKIFDQGDGYYILNDASIVQMCALTIAEKTGVEVVSVVTGGETIEPDANGKYNVEWNSEVTVTFKAADGYSIEETERTLVVKSDTTLEDIPDATRIWSIAESLRFAEVCGIPDDGLGGDYEEYFVLTNLCPTQTFDLTGVKFYIGKTKDVKKGIENAKCKFTITNALTIAAGGTLRLEQQDWWPNDETGDIKITNGSLLLYIYDADGGLVQSSAAEQGDFASVDAGGASLVATAFGAMTAADDWVPSYSDAYAFARFAAFDGIPADDASGNVGEWVRFTNLYDGAAIDLTGTRFVIGKKKDLEAGKASQCDFTLDAATVGDKRTIAAGGALTLAMTDVANGWKKITNGDLLFYFYDANGDLIQSGKIKQEDFPQYYGGGGDTGAGGESHLYATEFGHELKASDWMDSYVEPTEEDPEEDPEDFAIAVSAVTNATDATLIDAVRLDLSQVAKSGTVYVAWAPANRGGDITNWVGNAVAGTVTAEATELLVTAPSGYDLGSSDFRSVKFFFTESGDPEEATDLSPALALAGADWLAADGSRQLGDVRISEFQAKNGVTLVSAEGDASDWVELANDSDYPVNLAGWGLSDKAKNPYAQKIPSGVTIPAGGYLVVLCDDHYGVCSAGEVHVQLGLSSEAGEYLGLTDPAGAARTAITYGAQLKDCSCGFGRRGETLLAEDAAAEYRVGEGEWTAVDGAVGMATATGSFTAKAWQLPQESVANLATAQATVRTLTPTKVTTGIAAIDFAENTLGQLGLKSWGYYCAVEFTGTVIVPRAGQWTFAVGSSDGYRLEITRGDKLWSAEFPGTKRAYGKALTAFSFPEAGAYDVKVFYFEHTDGSQFDFYVAEGDYTTTESGGFSSDVFKLVGTDDSGVTCTGAIASRIAKDVAEEMKGVATTLDWRSGFLLAAAPGEGEECTLKVRHADGLVAKVNGTTVAEVATAKRDATAAVEWAEFAIPNDILVAGENMVELTVTNDDIDDADAIAGAMVERKSGEEELLYFKLPTPGAANTAKGYTAMTPKVQFSREHGYMTEPFLLSLWCEDDLSADIYYTLDGSSPTALNGTLYTGPIAITNTTCVRAAVPDAESILQYDTSATYLYLDEILAREQGVVPEGFPADKEINNHSMRYGMNQSVVNGSDRERLVRSFTNGIDTLSVVIDLKHLFDPASGIYVNPSGSGRDWERLTILEGICPTNSANGFTIPSGIRIRGGASRGTLYAKHSLRFFFRTDYGEGALETALFGNEGLASYKSVDLRTSQNYSWANENSWGETFIHECFSRDSQGAMGAPYTRSRYYHLYINGQYWGLYQTQERTDEDYAEAYLGGDADDYDVIKSDGEEVEASEGTIDAYERLCELSAEGFGGANAANYLKAQGRNADGTRNAEYPVLLAPENVMTFIICTHYVCDADSPANNWYNIVNNLHALRNRADDEYGNDHLNGFYFFRHDCEHTMGTYSSYTAGHRMGQCRYDQDPTTNGTTAAAATFGTIKSFNPEQLHWRLCENDDYRMAFADQVYKQCLKPGGAMTDEKALARFRARMVEIDDAIVGESARWAKGNQTRATWLKACNECLFFITNRLDYMIPQYRARGWYPSIDAPVVATTNFGFRIAIQAANDGVTLYYTTDGTDPRAAGGEVAATAQAYTNAIAVGSSWLNLKVRARTAEGEWSALEEGSFAAPAELSAEIEEFTVADGTVSIKMKSTPGVTYTLYQSAAPFGSEWVSAVSVNAESNSVELSTGRDANNSAYFYKVEVGE